MACPSIRQRQPAPEPRSRPGGAAALAPVPGGTTSDGPASVAGTPGRLATRAAVAVLGANELVLDRWGPATPPVWDPEDFEWTAGVEQAWPEIRAEVDALLSGPTEIPHIEDVTGGIPQGNEGPWRSFVLMHQGRWIEWNAARCPRTTRVVRSVPGLLMAGFSVLEPGTHITEHRGPNKGALRYQLGVIVPGPEGACRIRVGDELITWREGAGVVFDFTVPHEAWNDSDAVRVLLMLEVLTPLPRRLALPNALAQRAMGWFPTTRQHGPPSSSPGAHPAKAGPSEPTTRGDPVRDTFHDSHHQADLERDGYVVVPFLDDDQVEQLRRSYDELGAAPGDPHLACHSSFHTYDVDYKRTVDRRVKDVIGPILERTFDRQRALPCNFIVKWPAGTSGFGLHQDLSLVDERLHRSVEVWIALDDTDAVNGQLWMVPGSHAWIPTLRGIHAFPFAFADVTERIIQRHAVPVPVRRGQAVVFDHAVLHFSPPNRSGSPRLVAIDDLIPEEAQHLHYFGDGAGRVDAYEIDDSFWTDNSPFTLWRPPPRASCLGSVDFEYRALTDVDLDELVRTGVAIETDQRVTGALNAAKPWCHRCGSADVEGRPDRWVGNVTMLCEPCRDAEARRAPSPSHVGG